MKVFGQWRGERGRVEGWRGFTLRRSPAVVCSGILELCAEYFGTCADVVWQR